MITLILDNDQVDLIQTILLNYKLAHDKGPLYTRIEKIELAIIEQRNAIEHFAAAIKHGLFTEKDAALYMYMGCTDDHAAFKHILNRQYKYLPRF